MKTALLLSLAILSVGFVEAANNGKFKRLKIDLIEIMKLFMSRL
jgi:hypothetical protein